MKHTAKFICMATLLASTSVMAQQVAQSQPATKSATGVSLEEVTVTAQRRSESLQKVPIAVSAFTKTELERRQISRTIDLVNYVPNMEGHNNTALGTANAYSLRGLNNTESISTFDPPVGSYVDEVFIARQNANNFSFFDIDRVEVLRGPQGTLFGRNTTGGAINVIMKKPGEVLGGFAEAGYGEYSRYMGRGSIDVPVEQGKILTKLSGFYVHDDGYVKDLTTGEKLNGEESYGVRGAVQVRFSQAATWDLSADYMYSSYSNLVNFRDATTGDRVAFTSLSTTHGIGTSYASAGLANIPLGDVAKSTSVVSNVTYDVNDDTRVNFITGYRHLNQDFITDSFDSQSSTAIVYAADGFSRVSGKPGSATPLVNDGTHDQYSQELKATGHLMKGVIDYVVGLYWFREENVTSFANVTIPLTGSATVTQDRTMSNNTDAYAAYGQFDYHVTDKLKATAGIRFTEENKDIAFAPNKNPLPRSAPLNQPFTTADMVAAGIPTTLKKNIWTPRFDIDYQFTPDIMAFASATNGFKSGGWNARANYAAIALPFTPETIWSYETGVRSDWLNHRLRANLTGFYLDDKAFQLPAGYADPISKSVIYITRNFADLENYGLELETSAVVTDHLNVFWSAGWQHARYINIDPSVLAQASRCQAGTAVASNCNNGIVTPTGGIAKPVRAPAFSSTLGANYDIPITSEWSAVPNMSWTYTAPHFVGTANTPISYSKTRQIINAGLAVHNASAGLTVSFDCTNCTDQTYVTSYLIYPYLNEPRRWMFRVRKDF